MLKVLIADDERIILNGIHGCVDWSALDMRVVGTVQDGRAALGVIEEHEPDICLLDIRMPRVDGLKVAESYLARKPDGVVILISGYNEFSYAQQAVNTGVFAYILKPVDEDELKDTVSRAREHVLKRSEQRQALEQSSRLIKQNLTALRESFLHNWLVGNVQPEQLDEEMALHDIRLSPPFVVLLSRPQPGGDWTEECDETLREAVQAALPNGQTAYIGMQEAGTLAAVYAADADELWKGTAERLLNGWAKTDCALLVRQDEALDSREIPRLYARLLAELRAEERLSPIVQAMVRFAEQNYANHAIRLTEFAELHNTASSYLSRLFSQEMGVPFVQYLTGYRISRSLPYLKNPAYRINQIAEKVGYSSQHYYCESFRRVTGLSPSEWRKQYFAALPPEISKND